MGVDEIFEFLKERKGWWTAKEISQEITYINLHNIGKNLCSLRNNYEELIKYRWRDKKHCRFMEHKAK